MVTMSLSAVGDRNKCFRTDATGGYRSMHVYALTPGPVSPGEGGLCGWARLHMMMSQRLLFLLSLRSFGKIVSVQLFKV